MTPKRFWDYPKLRATERSRYATHQKRAAWSSAGTAIVN